MSMDTPFVYDRYVTGRYFVGRRTEGNALSNLLSQGENVVIYEPPKSGKMSLVQQTLFSMRVSGAKFNIFGMDLFNVRSLSSFLLKYGSAVIRSSASSPEEYESIISGYLGGTHFRFDQDRFAVCDEVISIDGEPGPEDISSMLCLPCRLSSDRGEKAIFIMEEFQNLMFASGYEEVFREMENLFSSEDRSCSFVLTGSSVNAMKYIFEEKRWFWRMAEHVPLYPIDEKEIADHLHKGYLLEGKVIDKDEAIGFCRIFDGNMWYVNHFASICGSLSKGYISTSVMMEAMNALISIHTPEFRAIVDGLTDFQLILLRAVLDGVTRFSSTEVMEQYGLNSSANVKRVKDALKKKEVITFNDKDEPVFLNPLFRYWLGKYYFGIQM